MQIRRQADTERTGGLLCLRGVHGWAVLMQQRVSRPPCLARQWRRINKTLSVSSMLLLLLEPHRAALNRAIPLPSAGHPVLTVTTSSMHVSDSLRPIHIRLLFTTRQGSPIHDDTTLKPRHTSFELEWKKCGPSNSKEVWCELGEGCHLRATICTRPCRLPAYCTHLQNPTYIQSSLQAHSYAPFPFLRVTRTARRSNKQMRDQVTLQYNAHCWWSQNKAFPLVKCIRRYV